MNAVLKMNPRPEPSIEDLAIEWLAAKAAETKAVERRRALDAAIASRMIVESGEGTVSDKFRTVKVAVTYKLTRSVDDAALISAWDNLPSKAQEAFRWKADLNTTKMRALQDVAPELYAAIAPFITTKPASPAVKVEEVA